MTSLACRRCRYALRGLPAVGRCPECGARYGDAMTRVEGQLQTCLDTKEAIRFLLIAHFSALGVAARDPWMSFGALAIACISLSLGLWSTADARNLTEGHTRWLTMRCVYTALLTAPLVLSVLRLDDPWRWNHPWRLAMLSLVPVLWAVTRSIANGYGEVASDKWAIALRAYSILTPSTLLLLLLLPDAMTSLGVYPVVPEFCFHVTAVLTAATYISGVVIVTVATRRLGRLALEFEDQLISE